MTIVPPVLDRGTMPLVAEVFGPTFQGEGPSAGQRAAFIRLGTCNLTCTWCIDPDTPVLMADFTWRKLYQLQVGDMVLSHRERKYEAVKVLAVTQRDVERRLRFGTASGREVVATPDHIWRVAGEWPHRARTDELLGHDLKVSKLQRQPTPRTPEWWRGWAKGLILGDGHVSTGAYPSVYLQITDEELAVAYSALVGTTRVTSPGPLLDSGKTVYRVSHVVHTIPWIVDGPESEEEVRGFLAGFFDAEGTVGGRGTQLSVSQKDPKVLGRVEMMMRQLGFTPTRSVYEGQGDLTINGRENVVRFMNQVTPVCERKVERAFRSDVFLGRDKVEWVEEAGPGEVFNVTTTSGLFMPAGILSEQCDTPYTWDWTRYDKMAELRPIHVLDLAARIESMDVRTVVITGGEPLLQQPAIIEVMHALRGIRFEIETNGTIVPQAALVDARPRFNVSPKLRNSMVVEKKRWKPRALAALLQADSVFKFVCVAPADLNEVQEYVVTVGIPRDRVWIMPEGITSHAVIEHTKDLVEAVLERGWNFTTRLHVLAWEGERSR